MSVSYSSWESIIELTNKFYDSSLQLFYTAEHLNVLCNILAYIGGLTSFEVVQTKVPLLEPIVLNQNLVFISLPLVAKFINLPVELPQNRVNYVRNINIFDNLMGVVREVRDCVQKPSNERIHVKTLNHRSSTLECLQAQYSIDDMVRFIQTLRLVLMAAHYTQHINQGIPFNSHKNFKFIECAVRKRTATETGNNTNINSIMPKRQRRHRL